MTPKCCNVYNTTLNSSVVRLPIGGGLPNCPAARRRQLLQDVEAQYSAAQVDVWTNPGVAANTRALRHLWKLWAEYRVAGWVRDTNKERGVARSAARVHDEDGRFVRAPLQAHLPPRQGNYFSAIFRKINFTSKN